MDRQESRAGAMGPLAEFHPLEALWTGPAPAFPSEQSARWQLRELRGPLVAAGALARWRGRLHFHPARFNAVVESRAITAAGRSAAIKPLTRP